MYILFKRIFCFLQNFFRFRFFYIDSLFYRTFYKIKREHAFSKKIPLTSKVAIYAFGAYGESLFIDYFSKFNIVKIYDMNYLKFGRYVSSAESIDESTFDYIIITVINEYATSFIENFLISKGIDKEKIALLLN